MEVGYSESYEDLTQDARLLLEESTGNIGTAILIKIQPLMPNEQNIKTAFLQAYHYDPVKGKGVPRGGREVSFICLLCLPQADFWDIISSTKVPCYTETGFLMGQHFEGPD